MGVEYKGPHFTFHDGTKSFGHLSHHMQCGCPRHKACIRRLNAVCTLIPPLYLLIFTCCGKACIGPPWFWVTLAPMSHGILYTLIILLVHTPSVGPYVSTLLPAITPCPVIISGYDCLSYPFHFARSRDGVYLCIPRDLPLIWTILSFPVNSSPINQPQWRCSWGIALFKPNPQRMYLIPSHSSHLDE